MTADAVAAAIGEPESAEIVYHILEHLAANGRVAASRSDNPAATTFTKL